MTPTANALVSVSAASGDADGSCTQTFDSSAGVTITRITNECIITFANVGTTTWTRPSGVTSIRALVVAGGGGGGANYGGGGGAGGFIDQTLSFTSTTASITVGAGGAGATSNSSNTLVAATKGGNSVLATTTTLTAIGGGLGGSSDLSEDVAAKSGGSGGGGIHGVSGGSSTVGQGSDGGAGVITGNGQTVTSGGGGGAGEAGAAGLANASNVVGGKGGTGVASDITGSSIFYAGGGGGGTHTGGAASGGTCASSPAQGGSGGGGSAGTCQAKNNSTTGAAGANGTANTGGGGGGGSVSVGRTASAVGGNGGSGVVIVRFSIDLIAPTIISSSAFTVAENISTSSYVALIVASESATISISGGVDSGRFTITAIDSVSAGIRFVASPDFEAPLDSGANNVFNISLIAIDRYGNSSSSMAISITVTNLNESALITAPSMSGLIYKGVSISITVASNVAGKVRFFVDGKRVANCLSISTTGTYPNMTAACQWKPTVTARHGFTASITPTDNTFAASTSAQAVYFVLKRSNTR